MNTTIDKCGACPFVLVPPDHITAPARCDAPEDAPGHYRPIIETPWRRHALCPMVGVNLRWPYTSGREENT